MLFSNMTAANFESRLSANYEDNTVRPIFGLPDELLDRILDFVAPDSKELIDIGYKSSMSVESFASEPPPVDDTSLNNLVNSVYGL